MEPPPLTREQKRLAAEWAERLAHGPFGPWPQTDLDPMPADADHAPVVIAFWEDAFEKGLVLPGAWIGHKGTAVGMREDPSRIASASPEEARWALTVALRNSRFIGGLLLSLLGEGYIQALLRRIAEDDDAHR